MKHFLRSIAVVSIFSFALVGGVSAQTDVAPEPTLYGAGETGCTLNGQPIPCDELAAKAKTAAGYGLGILAVIGVVLFVAFIFWLVMIIHAASHPIPNKAVWIIVQIIFGVFGSIIYYFFVKRSFVATAAPATPMAPPTMPGQMT